MVLITGCPNEHFATMPTIQGLQIVGKQKLHKQVLTLLLLIVFLPCTHYEKRGMGS